MDSERKALLQLQLLPSVIVTPRPFFCLMLVPNVADFVYHFHYDSSM